MAAPAQSSRRPPRPPDELTAKVAPVMERVDRFWTRVTDGMRIDQLWKQFITDARSSYQLYSMEIDAERGAGVSKGKHFLRMVGQFFWAVLEKLSPARRVLVLVAIFLILFPGGEATWEGSAGSVHYSLNTHFFGGLLMFILLILEVGDRVVMKRDLQIAKEIQAWLLPSQPPEVAGLEIAFATRPANTVAGDYYDVFGRPAAGSLNPTFL